jgi:type IV pilus assembly protein PilA
LLRLNEAARPGSCYRGGLHNAAGDLVLSCRQHRKMLTSRAGFTMIELMVVVVIIAILALMAVPSFQDQIVRDQINKALPLADIAKTPAAVSWATLQSFPADNAAAGLPPAEKIVNDAINSVAVQDGAVHITFGNRANGVITGKILSLRAAVVEDAPVVPVTWVCGYAEAPDKMTLHGQNRTNIPASFLPFACRSRAANK